MPKKRYNAEEIIHKLREADVLIAQGKTVSETCKQLGITDQTYYRWHVIMNQEIQARSRSVDLNQKRTL